jgi:hypothetical protein
MILLNGVPVIIGMGLVHVTIINIFAITVEYNILKSRTQIRNLRLKTVLANMTSLVAGLIALNGDLFEMDGHLSAYYKFTLVAGLLGLFMVNVAIEFPVYSFRHEMEPKRRIFEVVLQANLWTNLPVFVVYGLLLF